MDLYTTYLHVNSYPRCGTTKGGMSSTLGVNPLCGPQQGTPIVVHNRDIPNVLPMWRFFALPTNPQCGAYFSIGCSTPQRLSSHIFYVTTRFLLMTSRASPLYCLLSSRYISLLYRVGIKLILNSCYWSSSSTPTSSTLRCQHVGEASTTS